MVRVFTYTTDAASLRTKRTAGSRPVTASRRNRTRPLGRSTLLRTTGIGQVTTRAPRRASSAPSGPLAGSTAVTGWPADVNASTDSSNILSEP